MDSVLYQEPRHRRILRVVAIALLHLQLQLPAWKWPLFMLLIINGALCFASLVFIIGSLAFKTVKVDFAGSIFLTFAQFCKKPFDIYPALVRKLLLYLVPLGFVSYVPAAFLLGKIGFLWLWSFVVTPLLLWLSRRVWNGLSASYEGASS